MDNMKPIDLGGGYRLTIQQNLGDSNRVRAVVKDVHGTVVARGPVTTLDNIAESRQQAMLEYVDKVLKPLEKPEDDFADDYTANDEDED
jgi:hypothetical protein